MSRSFSVVVRLGVSKAEWPADLILDEAQVESLEPIVHGAIRFPGTARRRAPMQAAALRYFN
jgi:hypothetical protein